MLLNAHLYMVKVSQVNEREIYKICLEYWVRLVAGLYEELQNIQMGLPAGGESALLMGLSLSGGTAVNGGNGVGLRKAIYSDVLSNLRLVVVERMVKPEEVRVFSLLTLSLLAPTQS